MASPLVKDIIERYIGEMNGANGIPGLKPLGTSHLYSLRAMQRKPIGQIIAKDLTKAHIKTHCLARINVDKVCPATVNQDMCYLKSALDYADSEFDDYKGVSGKAIKKARKFLVTHNLIGKSTPRKRCPTGQELDQLMGYFMAPGRRTKIRMCEIILFALESTRRISEICRITHGDIDWSHLDKDGLPAPMYTVRDLKHPTKKKGNDKAFAILPGLDEIIRRQPRLRPDDPTERLFPFNAQSAGQAYTRAKKELGIVNLRFHDNRREAITRWLKVLSSSSRVRLISGHETTQILERVYDGTKSESLHGEIAEIARVKQMQAAA